MNTQVSPHMIGSGRESEFSVDALSSPQFARARSAARWSHVPMKMSHYGRELAPSEADANEAAALYVRAMEGWNLGSGDAFAAPFAEDADFVAFDGERFRGRDEIARFHDAEFRTHLKGTRLVGEVTDVRFLGDDVAVMHATGGTVLRGKSEPAPARNSIQTLVAVRQKGEWKVVAFQNTRVRPIGLNLGGTLLWLLSDRLWTWCLPKNARG